MLFSWYRRNCVSLFCCIFCSDDGATSVIEDIANSWAISVFWGILRLDTPFKNSFVFDIFFNAVFVEFATSNDNFLAASDIRRPTEFIIWCEWIILTSSASGAESNSNIISMGLEINAVIIETTTVINKIVRIENFGWLNIHEELSSLLLTTQAQ